MHWVVDPSLLMKLNMGVDCNTLVIYVMDKVTLRFIHLQEFGSSRTRLCQVAYAVGFEPTREKLVQFRNFSQLFGTFNRDFLDI